MKILYVALKYDSGRPERGFSFEHYNIYDSLVKMNNGQHAIIYFPFDEEISKLGYQGMNKKLLETVYREKPDLCFFYLFAEEIKKETIKEITEKGNTITYNWFADDNWRFDSFSKYFAPCFHFVSTTDLKAIPKYQKIGYQNVIKTQYACNHFLYKPVSENSNSLTKDYEFDVSFVGQPYGSRRKIIEAVNRSGVAKVESFGHGWPNGRVSQEKMIRIFEKSKINLNFTSTSIGWTLKGLAHLFLKRKVKWILPQNPMDIIANIKMFITSKGGQIKGRNFEVPGCGGFLLTGTPDNLEDYYELGKEVAVFKNTDDLINKIKYYLSNPEEMEKIRIAGYEKTLREHTYEKRFNDIFKKMGLV